LWQKIQCVFNSFSVSNITSQMPQEIKSDIFDGVTTSADGDDDEEDDFPDLTLSRSSSIQSRF
jgi:hypothetical protein